MSWFKWKRTTPGAAPPPSPPPAAQPETDLERFARWRRYWARVNAHQAVVHAQQEQQEADARAQRAERAREQMAAMMARNGGSWFPGDELDLPRMGPEIIPLEGGDPDDPRFYEWIKWR